MCHVGWICCSRASRAPDAHHKCRPPIPRHNKHIVAQVVRLDMLPHDMQHDAACVAPGPIVHVCSSQSVMKDCSFVNNYVVLLSAWASDVLLGIIIRVVTHGPLATTPTSSCACEGFRRRMMPSRYMTAAAAATATFGCSEGRGYCKYVDIFPSGPACSPVGQQARSYCTEKN